MCAPQLLAGDLPLKAPEDLAAFNLLHTSLDRRDWGVWLKAFDVKSVDALSGEVFSTLDMAAKAAVMGEGVAIGDVPLLGDELAAGTLVRPFAELAFTAESESYRLIGRAGSWDDPRIGAFRSWLLEAATTPN